MMENFEDESVKIEFSQIFTDSDILQRVQRVPKDGYLMNRNKATMVHRHGVQVQRTTQNLIAPTIKLETFIGC